MAHTLDLRIFELLTARLCHDLVGPVGAAGNGAELLRELGAEEAGDAVDLIAESASKAADRLRFYRVAYGLAGGSIGTIEEARELAAGMFADQKFTVDWTPPPAGQARLGDGAGKLLLNMLLLAGEAMAREGSITVGVEAGEDATRLEVSARGDGVELDEDTLAGLRTTASIDALTPRTVQGYFTARLAESLGAALEVEQRDQAVRLTSTLAGGV